MCVYSVITDYQFNDWQSRRLGPSYYTPQITPKEIQALYDVLQAAKKFDEVTGQPDCELDAKKERLSQLAKELGVEISFP